MLSAYLINKGAELWGKKWRGAVLWHLKDGPLRFSQLKAMMLDCSVKVLTETLKDLDSTGLIERNVYSENMPIKVIYSLHPDTIPLIESQIVYRKALLEYFNKRREHLTPEVIQLLEEELLTAE
jgi:DNA-binding HxlR family transcriptional regulator